MERVRFELQECREHNRWDRRAAILQESLGAMAEWRTSLLLLSRIVRELRLTGLTEEYALALDAPNQDVIDSCIRHSMKGKHPTLCHRMLATLAPLLRLDVILTTNFDSLLEHAFADANNPLTTFEVHLHSDLPPWSAVADQRSLIKMHGNLYSLRVDYTLDTLPTELDRSRFLDYLRSTERTSRHTLDHTPPLSPPPDAFRNHLLVMGVSAGERRTRAFIEHAWTHLGSHFKVYWLCHTQQDVRTVQAFTSEYRIRSRKMDSDWQGSYILRHTHLGLFFLQLYQTIRRGVPTTGIIFPSVSRLAIPLFASNNRQTEDVEQSKQRFIANIERHLSVVQSRTFHKHKLLIVTSTADKAGVTSACSMVFERAQEKGQIGLWLDMNDISSTDDLFEQLLDAATYRVGIEHWIPVYVENFPRPRASEIRKIASTVNADWLIVLNARETPGTNLTDDFSVLNDPEAPNGWIDATSSYRQSDSNINDDRSNTCRHFLEFVLELCAPPTNTRPYSASITVVLVCRKTYTTDHLPFDPPVITACKSHRLTNHIIELSANCTAFEENNVVHDTIKWINVDEPAKRDVRRRFVYSLLLLQRTRYLATIWNIAISPNLQTEPNTAPQWLGELEAVGLIRRKPGGFIWIQARTRTRLRELFRSSASRKSYLAQLRQSDAARAATLAAQLRKTFTNWDSLSDTAEIHWHLALWYRRVLAASGAPAAVFEAVYHACRSAECFVAEPFTVDRLQQCADRLNTASSLLHSHAFLIQTKGYSRGSCRRLTHIRDTRCPVIARALPLACDYIDVKALAKVETAIRTLQIGCTEVMRAVAREVGEDRRAYARQEEIKSLLAAKSRVPIITERASTHAMLDNVVVDVVEAQLDMRMQWVRWWRWNGMLGIASRSYRPARSSLIRALISITNPELAALAASRPLDELWKPTMLMPELTKLLAACRKGTATILQSTTLPDQQQLRLESARVLEEMVALDLLVASLSRRCPGNVWTASQTADVTEQITIGLAIVETILTNDRSADSHDSIPALWCQSRFLMHRSICSLMQKRYTCAMRELADADAALSLGVDSRRQGSDQGIIELYRAEVRLLAAGDVEVPVMVKGKCAMRRFDDLAAVMQRPTPKSALWHSDAKAMVEENSQLSDFERIQQRERMRTALSLVEDALTYLERAESMLLARRRNVWWTTWFLQRRLRASALCLWASVFETGTPIPFLGVEAALPSASTVADSIVEHAVRMIRVDAYRLATIVEAYADCARAFYTRLLLDANADRQVERQVAMHRQLVALTERLKDVCQLRRGSNVPTEEASQENEERDRMRRLRNAAMDEDVLSYVKAVEASAGRTAEYIANVLA